VYGTPYTVPAGKAAELIVGGLAFVSIVIVASKARDSRTSSAERCRMRRARTELDVEETRGFELPGRIAKNDMALVSASDLMPHCPVVGVGAPEPMCPATHSGSQGFSWSPVPSSLDNILQPPKSIRIT
jgi:hypothetical protein